MITWNNSIPNPTLDPQFQNTKKFQTLNIAD